MLSIYLIEKWFNPDLTPCRSHCRVSMCCAAFWSPGLSGCLHFVEETRYYQVGAASVTIVRLSPWNVLNQTQWTSLLLSHCRKKSFIGGSKLPDKKCKWVLYAFHHFFIMLKPQSVPYNIVKKKTMYLIQWGTFGRELVG